MSTSDRTLSFCITAAAVVLLGSLASADAEELGYTPLRPYTSVGVIPLHDASNIHEGAMLLTEMLAARLDERFEDAEFILLDAEAVEPARWPLLPDEAVELGDELGVDALLDGVFGGVEIVGGTWPNLGSDVPQARGDLRWRLIDCETGRLVLARASGGRKPKIYSPRIRTTEHLIRQVMQDLVCAVGDELEEAVVLAGTQEPETDHQPAGAADTDSHSS